MRNSIDCNASETIPIYVYRPGRDFIAEEVSSWRQVPFLIKDPVCCTGFQEVTDPAQAVYLFFPYFMEHMTEKKRIAGMWDFIRSLQHIKARESEHVFFSDHDSSAPYITQSVWFRASVNRIERDPFCYAIPFLTGDLAGGAEFDPQHIKYHTSFVGYVGLCGERLPLLRAITADSRLISLIDPVRGFHGLLDEATRNIRRKKYLEALTASLTVLCPRGDGENSIRFFETLSAGRIPVLVSDNVLLPLEDVIPYKEFVLQISTHDEQRAGSILFDWLASQDDGQIKLRCRKARAAWETYFSPAVFSELVYRVLQNHQLHKVHGGHWQREDQVLSSQLAATAQKKMKENDIQEAEYFLLRAIIKNPRNAVLYNDLGVMMFKQGKIGQAEQAFRKALAYDPRLFWGHVNLGEVLLVSRDNIGALASFRRASVLVPDHPVPASRLKELGLGN